MTNKEGRGSLFINKRKEKETHKDYEGDCLIGGKRYWIAGWVHVGENCGKYISLDFRSVEDKP